MPREPRRRRHLGTAGYLGLALAGVALLLGPSYSLWAGHEYLAWLAAWSVVTFVAYAIDKRAAKQTDAPRINESALHGMALAGGFVGGWIGRHTLRHKTKKPVFAVVLVVATALHVALLLWAWWAS
jgi:uncharacterized membrane protein YsdA (DUF1294 family)